MTPRDELIRLVLSHFERFPQLEASVGDLARVLRQSPGQVRAALEDLESQGKVQHRDVTRAPLTQVWSRAA